MSSDWAVLPLRRLSSAQQYLWDKSPTIPKVFILVQSPVGKNPAFPIDFGVETSTAPNSDIFVKKLELDVERIRKFDSLLLQYFKAAKVHDYLPPRKPQKGAPPVSEQLQKYFDELLKIPGICIFYGFTDLFQVEATKFLQPAPS
jgi:hypothetical protein